MKLKGRLEISRDARKDSFWRTIATNGNVLAGATEGYRNAADMRRSLVTSTAIQLASLTDEEAADCLAYLALCRAADAETKVA